MSQIGSILRLRRQLARNRLADLSAMRRRRGLVLVVAAVVALLAGGHLAAPALMEPPIDLATPRGLSPDDLPPGAAALEAAFWLTTLLAAVLNFRVLELLFRRNDVLALQNLPVEPGPLFFDRLINSLTESFLTALAAALFFAPLLWHGGLSAFLASAAMLFGGLFVGASVSLAVMLYSGQQLLPSKGRKGKSRPTLGDSYGGPGQLLLYAPAVALGAIAVLALLWKLLLGEPLRLGAFNEPFWIGTSLLVGLVAICLLSAWRVFSGHYYAIAPRFREVDAAEYSALIEYQQSSFDERRRWEWGLPREAARTCRALLIDDDRRIAGSRIGYAVVVVLAILGLLILDMEALPGWALAALPIALVGAIVNPWYRVAKRADALDESMGLPVTHWERHRAVDRLGLREFFFVGAPYGTAAAIILGYIRGLGAEGALIGAAAIASGLAISGGISILRFVGISTTSLRWLPATFAALFTGVAIFSLWAAVTVGLAAGLASAGLVLFRSKESR